MLRLGVLVSGNGTNLQAILNAIAAKKLDAKVEIVISNKADAFALKRATEAGVKNTVITHKDKPTREAFDAELVAALRAASIDWVVLAGFMRVLTPVFLRAFPGRIINIHPSLLPEFPGINAQRQALESGVAVTGCTVHFVEEGVDAGPVIGRQEVVVLPDDDEASLSERIHHAEHELLVSVLGEIAAGQVTPLATLPSTE